MEPLPGTAKKPIQILVDREELSEKDLAAKGKDVNKCWKAAYNGLVYGYGYGMVVHNLTASEYSKINNYLKTDRTAGDVLSWLYTKHTRQSLDDHYIGYEGEAHITRLGDREETCEVLEALLVCHQYILCRILERGLLQNESSLANYEPQADLRVVTAIYCRFRIHISRLSGMEDYLRIVEGDMGKLKVEKYRSTLVSKTNTLEQNGRESWEWGWGRNARQACEYEDEGLYVVYTLFPTAQSGFYDEIVGSIGVYMTVTEEVIRGFTAQYKSWHGRYYEYVSPLHPGKPLQSRTFYMTMGSSIVLPISCVVRIGGHWKYDVQVLGYVLEASRVDWAKMTYLHREDDGEYDDIDEYGMETELVQQDEDSETKYVSWREFKEQHPNETGFMIGTIPTIMEIQLDHPSRAARVRSFYDVLPHPQRLKEVYENNPIMKLVAKKGPDM